MLDANISFVFKNVTCTRILPSPCTAPSQAFSANVSETRGNCSPGQRDLKRIGHMVTELDKLEFWIWNLVSFMYRPVCVSACVGCCMNTLEQEAHQMEPPSPLISWVNSFPSRFLNRTACFPWKVSYLRESLMSPWKKWSWMKSNSEARPSTVFLFHYTSIFIILQPLGSAWTEAQGGQIVIIHVKYMFFQLLLTIKVNLVAKNMQSAYFCLIFHVKQKKTVSRGFNLISNSWWNPRWQPRWRPFLVTSQASSSATTRIIYLILRLSTQDKIVSKYCNISKNSGFHSPPPPPHPHILRWGYEFACTSVY